MNRLFIAFLLCATLGCGPNPASIDELNQVTKSAADTTEKLRLLNASVVQLAEQVKSRAYGRKDFVDGCLPGILHARQRERAGRFVRKENVHS